MARALQDGRYVFTQKNRLILGHERLYHRRSGRLYSLLWRTGIVGIHAVNSPSVISPNIMIIHLNGWPGVGKQTIGKVLAEQIGARFIHNHLLHDVAIICAGFHSPERWPLYEKVRAAAYETLAKLPPAEILVMTNAIAANAPREQEAWRHVVNLAHARGSVLVPVVLEVDRAEHFRRVQSAERVGRKLTAPAVLEEFFSIDQVHRPDVPELLALDVTHLSPKEAAEQIIARVSALGYTIHAATPSG